MWILHFQKVGIWIFVRCRIYHLRLQERVAALLRNKAENCSAIRGIAGHTCRKCRFGAFRLYGSGFSYDSELLTRSQKKIEIIFRTTHHIRCALRKIAAPLSDIVALALSVTRHMDFRTVPHLSAAFSEDSRNPMFGKT